MAPRKTTQPAIRQKAQLSTVQMKAAVARLEQRVADLRALDVRTIQSGDAPEIKRLEAAIENTVSSIFGPDSHEYNKLRPSWDIDSTGYSVVLNLGYGPSGGPSIADIQDGIARGRDRALALLQQAADSIKEELQYLPKTFDAREFLASPDDARATEPNSRDVFVVHGHDDAARLEVSSLLSKAGLNPIVLHEQPNKGQTVIEKLERHSDVSFAVVLLTPDDVGGPVDGEMQQRARQNVIAELFYFIGKLDRARVCALTKGQIERPSDIGGIIYEPMDEHGGWKTKLLRELEAAGHKVDWANALR